MTAEVLVEQLPSAIGRRVRDLRSSRGLTLDQLAENSGVSRRMIINIESGGANASIATLLRLASALGSPLAELVDDRPSAPVIVTRAADRQSLWTGDSGGSAELVASSDMLELWKWCLQPGESYSSEAHSAGTRELLHVHSGRLGLEVGGEVTTLSPGDGVSFGADAPHSYSCAGRRPVRFTMTVLEPMSRMRP
ncbi:MAG: cupin domain-containing protein [Candidatus Nanopelagicales bacterium]|jgi:transcriptional regulator with XRE-family HTH domain